MQIQVKGMDKVISRLDQLGVRAKFAAAKALNEAAYATMMAERKEIADSFTGPVPYIVRSPRMTNATNDNLSAKVYLPGEEADVNVSDILAPHIKGGGRRTVKASEHRLRDAGIMRPDQYIVPGPGAPRDRNGNIPAGQMQKILGYVKAYRESGYNRTSKTNGYYWIYGVGIFRHQASLGSGNRRWATKHGGPSIPVLFFVNKPQYEAGRFDFYYAGRRVARAALGAAIKKHLRVELKR